MDESQAQAVHLRMEQAQETLKEAKALQDHDLWRGVINRSYYAMFYAVLALAVLKDVAISKHTHAVAFFDKEFVHKGVFQRSFPAPYTMASTNAKPVTMAKFGKSSMVMLRLHYQRQRPL